MAVYPKGDKFFVKFSLKGKNVREFGFASEAEGEAWELQARASLKLGKPLPPREGVATVGGKDSGALSNALRSATILHWNKLRGGGEKSIL